MRPVDYHSVWGCILDYLIGDRRQYGSSSSYSFSLEEMPECVVEALKGKDEKRAGEGAMIAMALSSSSAKHYISEKWGLYHWVYIIRILCKTTKAAVDSHNRRNKRYMTGPEYIRNLSPWAKWHDSHYLDSYNYDKSNKPTNPYRKLIRDPIHELNFRSWNNRKNKHLIRIMWKEYCEKWKPWFTDKKDMDNSWRIPCDEKHHAYNVFRYYLTEEEFRTRWPNA